jgi:calcineurin-like phosphoesterase family protein
MNKEMVEKWNAVVKPEDTVYYIGDFSLAFSPVEVYTKLMNGKKVLISGNHDFTHPYNKKSRNADSRKMWEDKYREQGWIIAPLIQCFEFHNAEDQTSKGCVKELKKTVFKMCHIPYAHSAGDAYQDKFKKYRPEDDGTVLLCGHVHSIWKTKRSDKGTLMINVGVDVWNYAPVSLDQIVQLTEEQNG